MAKPLFASQNNFPNFFTVQGSLLQSCGVCVDYFGAIDHHPLLVVAVGAVRPTPVGAVPLGECFFGGLTPFREPLSCGIAPSEGPTFGETASSGDPALGATI